jgi:hypothetical protein
MKFITCIITIIFFSTGASALAEKQDEIEYLLSFVAESNCIFIRNGKEHQAKKASEHLAMKYNHVRGRIKTAENFIDKIASKSSLTRRAYTIRCNDKQEVPTEQWLRDALQSYRKAALQKIDVIK